MFLIDKLKEWNKFNGCYNRKEYISNFLIGFSFLIISCIIFAFFYYFSKLIGEISFLLFLLYFTFINMNMTTKRLHDINLSGWWQILLLIPIIGIIFAFYIVLKPSSDRGINKFL